MMNECYLCHSLDDSARFVSTSGGLFYEIARHKIEEDHAVVFGAAFDEFYHVQHISIERVEDLYTLQGSKYPQSDISQVYEIISQLLEKGKIVVFSGTPCQCAAVRNYAGMHDKLLLVDLICYGVASPGVWEAYLDSYYREKNIRAIRFKDKTYGWKNWNTCIELEDEAFFLRGITNPFMNYYMNGLYVRPSCSVCPFKGDRRFSDITIGDAWGDGENSTLNDDQGLSIAVVHSEYGKQCIEGLLDRITAEKVDFNKFIAGNPYYWKIPKYDMSKREKFRLQWHTRGFKSAFEEFCIPHGFRRLKYEFLLRCGRKKLKNVEK